MNYSDITAAARAKASEATLIECMLAIADCHNTLRVGEHDGTPYGVKLWAEIDAYRDRSLELSRL